MAAKRIIERITDAFTEAKVNRESGQITGVLICGTSSENGRDYPVAVLRRDHARYEGRPVNADHSREATVDRRLGWFSDISPGKDGRPRGTFNVLKTHPMYERVMEAAERNPGLFGFSHVAMCETKIGKDGREVIEAIQRVESIDLVADPATTKGLFESRGTAVPTTIKMLAEWVTKNPKSTTEQILKLKRLAEDDSAAGVTAMDDAPAEDLDPNEAISASFKSAIMAVVEAAMNGGDPKAAIAKIKKLLNSHGDATTEPEAPTEPVDDYDPAVESRAKAKIDPLLILEDCRKQGIQPSGAELKALCFMESLDRAAWITDQRAKTPGEKPSSGTRSSAGSNRRTEAKKVSEVKDVKTFLEAISA